MELDLVKTAAIFVAIIAVGIGGLVASPTGMARSTVLTMVAPTMIIFGLVCLALGVAHGQYRASAAR